MGASGWHYRVDYDPDVGAALERLRQQVFEAGDYAKPLDLIPGFPREAAAEDMREMAEMSGEPLDEASIGRFVAGADPASIDEALSWAMESGTHSILDMAEGVGGEPGFGVVTALAPDQYAELFGTDTPADDQVAAAVDGLDELIEDRWQALYVVGYDGDRPTSLWFVGVSGD